MVTSDPIRIGLVGCGGIVRQNHLPALVALPDVVDVVAVADPERAAREAVASVADVPADRRYVDHGELLAAEELDAVLIATPHHLHAEQAIAAAEAGVDVIGEKPMATSLADADRIVTAVEDAGVRYAAVHNFLFMPGTRQALRLLESGAVEEPRVVRAKSLFRKNNRLDPERNWRASKAAGGGSLLDTCYHELYLTEALAGSPVRYVEARVTTEFAPMDADDVSLLLLEHESGAVSTVATSWGVPGGGGGETANLCEVTGTGGSLRVVRRGRELLRYAEDDGWEEVPLDHGFDEEELARAGHARLLEATLQSLADGTAPPVTLSQARHNMAIVAAARRASRNRSAVDVTEL